MGCGHYGSSISIFISIELIFSFFCDVGCIVSVADSTDSYVSSLGDPAMKNPNARFAFEAWNFCNEVGSEAPNMGSPRLADCADLQCSTPSAPGSLYFLFHYLAMWNLVFYSLTIKGLNVISFNRSPT